MVAAAPHLPVIAVIPVVNANIKSKTLFAVLDLENG
jgi:hypothetical protein